MPDNGRDETKAATTVMDVEPNYLCTGKHTEEHALSFVGSNGTAAERRARALEKVNAMNKMKAAANEWYREQILAEFILPEVHKREVQFEDTDCIVKPVQTWRQLITAWKQKRVSAKDLWYIMYGTFDDNPGWDERLEEDYLQSINAQYSRPLKPGGYQQLPETGCFRKLCNNQRGELLSRINTAGMKTHGVSI